MKVQQLKEEARGRASRSVAGKRIWSRGSMRAMPWPAKVEQRVRDMGRGSLNDSPHISEREKCNQKRTTWKLILLRLATLSSHYGQLACKSNGQTSLLVDAGGILLGYLTDLFQMAF